MKAQIARREERDSRAEAKFARQKVKSHCMVMKYVARLRSKNFYMRGIGRRLYRTGHIGAFERKSPRGFSRDNSATV